MQLSNRTKVFISYSHKDTKYLEGLLPHLEYFRRNNKIDYWVDTEIKPGAIWYKEIENALPLTKVALLLISIDFLNSQFITEYELPSLLKAAQTEGVRILQVILRPCNLDGDLLQFQALNPSKPLSGMKGYQREAFWVKIANIIREELKNQELQGNSVNSTTDDNEYIDMLWKDVKTLFSSVEQLLTILKMQDIAVLKNKVQQLEREIQSDNIDKQKLSEIVRELSSVIYTSQQIISDRKAFLPSALNTLKAQETQFLKTFNRIENEQEHIIEEECTIFRTRLGKQVKNLEEIFFTDICKKIEEWTDQYIIQHPMSIFDIIIPSQRKDSVERITEELTEFLTEKVANEYQVWENSKIWPIVDLLINDLTKNLNGKISSLGFYEKVRVENRANDVTQAFSSVNGHTLGLLISSMPIITPIRIENIIFSLIAIENINWRIKKTVEKAFISHISSSRQERLKQIFDLMDGRLSEFIMEFRVFVQYSHRQQAISINKEKQNLSMRIENEDQELSTASDDLFVIDNELNNLIRQNFPNENLPNGG